METDTHRNTSHPSVGELMMDNNDNNYVVPICDKRMQIKSRAFSVIAGRIARRKTSSIYIT